ncbi:MAG: MFS transporter, partial [Muribaculaceae bacterium]|nr:MFS transporter [Muribaculaceae bacterium]
WNRLGRRLPYLVGGALVAIIVMGFLPNSGSLGLGVSQAIIFGLVMLMFLDTSINMAMQPFKMLVGDFVNEKQKGLAYSIQSFLCNAGSVVGYIAPIVLAMFLSNTAPAGEVPATVTWSFYLGAAILLLCVIYTFANVKEMPPHEYAVYHGIKEEPVSDGKKEKVNMIALLVKAPKVFWTVGLVQFFCWAAFLYMWTYSTDAIASHAFNAPSIEEVTGITLNGKSYDDKYLFNGTTLLLAEGRQTLAGIKVDGETMVANTVVVDGDTIIAGGEPVYTNGVAKVSPDGSEVAKAGKSIMVDGREVAVTQSAATVSALSQIKPGDQLILAHIATDPHGTGKYVLEQTTDLPVIGQNDEISLNYKTVLNAASKEYQDAGDWNGVLLAIQAIAAVIWAVVLSQFRRRKLGYSLSLLIGALGFISVYFIHDPNLLSVSYALMGCAWAAILAMPFTILTNALSGNHIGTYLGLFNCTICIPQIIAALCGGLVLSWFPVGANGAPQTVMMLVVSGILLAVGSLFVWNIRETFGSAKQ